MREDQESAGETERGSREVRQHLSSAREDRGRGLLNSPGYCSPKMFLEGRFLSLVTERIQRQRSQESEARIYLSNSLSQRESRKSQVSSCAEFLWQASYVGCRNEGAEYPLGREGLGFVFPDCHSSSIFPRRGGLFVLI